MRADLDKARAIAVEHNTKLSIAKDQLAEQMNELKETFGCDSVAEAEAKLAKVVAKLDEKLSELEEWV